MSKFLTVIPVDDAVDSVLRISPTPVAETIPLDTACGRILTDDIMTDSDIPGFDRSVVDGYAVLAADTAGAGDAIPTLLRCTGRIVMGRPEPSTAIEPGTCTYIPTGGMLPAGADAVVMMEYAEEVGDTVLVKKAVSHWENILLRDEDFKQGRVVFSQGRRISPQDTGVLAACGCAAVRVAKKPVVGIISTGNELVPVEMEPCPGQVRDANATMLAAYLTEYGCVPRYYGIIPDERDAFEAILAQAVPECDVVLISGGSSKGDRDMTAAVIAALGEVLVHGIAIAPGKPTIIGQIGGKPVFGLPGHPTSAFVVLIAIVRPLLDRMLGIPKSLLRTERATLAINIPSKRGREEYVRVTLEKGVATPIFGKSGLLNTLIQSSGLVRIPEGAEGLEQGCPVEVIVW